MTEEFSIGSVVPEIKIPEITTELIAQQRPEVPGVKYTENGIPFATEDIELLKSDTKENYIHQRELLKESVGEINSLQNGEDLRKFLDSISGSLRTLVVNSGEIDLKPKEYDNVKYIQPAVKLRGIDSNFEAVVIPVNGLISIKSSSLPFNEKGRPVGGFQLYLPIKEGDRRYFNQTLTLSKFDGNGNFVKGVNLERIKPEDVDYFKNYLKETLEGVLKNSQEKIEVREDEELNSLLKISGHVIESDSNNVDINGFERKEASSEPLINLEKLSDKEVQELHARLTEESKRRGLSLNK